MRWPWTRDGGEGVPAWAADVMDAGAFGAFRRAVETELGRLDASATVDFGEGFARAGEVTLGLHNLVQTCALVLRRDWGG